MFAEVNGTRLYYEVTGSGPALLLVHGNGEDHTIFAELAAALADRFTVYACDSRGHGQSAPAAELHYEEMAEDYAALIRQLGLDRPFFYGFSDGGILALLLASNYPQLLSGLAASGANTEPRALRGYMRGFISLVNLFRPSPLLRLMLREPHIAAEQLARIEVPALILAGSRDLVREYDTRFIAGSIAGAELRIFEGEGHMSYVVHKDTLAPVLREFYERRVEGA